MKTQNTPARQVNHKVGGDMHRAQTEHKQGFSLCFGFLVSVFYLCFGFCVLCSNPAQADTTQPHIKADVSGDEVVSAYDAALIAQRAVGLIDTFPVEGGGE